MAPCPSPARRRALLAITAGLAAAAALRPARGAAAPLLLGLPPYLPYERLQERCAPLAAYLTDQLARPVNIRIGQSYAEHLDFVGQSAVDLALLGPVSVATLLARKAPIVLLGRQHANDAGRQGGQLAVRADSPLGAVTALRGRRLGYIHPLSTMGYLAPRLLLRQHGLGDAQLLNPRFVGSAGNLAIAVLAGEVDAGGLPQEAFDAAADRGLRALAPLPDMPEAVFAATPRLGAAGSAAARAALLELHRNAAGQAALTRLRPGLRAVVPTRAADYLALAPLIAAVRGGHG